MLPDMSDVLTEWEQDVFLKTVTTTTVDFIPTSTVASASLKAVIQPAKKEALNPDSLDWSREYLMVHSKQLLTLGQFIEYKGRDFKIIDTAGYNDYGFSEAVAEETKVALL